MGLMFMFLITVNLNFSFVYKLTTYGASLVNSRLFPTDVLPSY